jgi:hypothetical protein
VSGRRALSLAALLFAGALAPAGCGFIAASKVSHTKPSGFVLRGRVTVPVTTGLTRAVGVACAAPYPDVVANATVTVTDPDGHEIATGYLGDGVIAHGQSGVTCDFPFQIPAVPGGVASYRIAVADRAPKEFPAKALREDETAVLTYSDAS